MKKIISITLVISIIFVSGCLEEKDEFYVNPDGSGKVVIKIGDSHLFF